ncbi:MAG: serine--tRNA ligase, partial [Muribaculaceae bacterium]|nr:serine--tRNA ligase [Muribaculaceae bacterium]
MLTLQQIKADPHFIVERLAVKGFDGNKPIARVLALDDMRRQLQLKSDNASAELNKMSASIGKAMKEGRKDEAEKAKENV